MADGLDTVVDLELRLVGRMRLLRRDGVEITPKGRKAQGLLALLGVAPELRRHRNWLQDKLWSDRGAGAGGGEPAAGARRAPPVARRGERLPDHRGRLGGARPGPGARQARSRPRRLGADRRAARVRRRARHPGSGVRGLDPRPARGVRRAAGGGAAPGAPGGRRRRDGRRAAGRGRGRAAVDRGDAADAAERLARRAADRRRSGDRRDRAAHPLPAARRHRLQLHLRASIRAFPRASSAPGSARAT